MGTGIPLRHGLLALSVAAFFFLSALARAGEAPIDPARLSTAVTAGLKVLQLGTLRYEERSNCFTCHNQTLPMLAQVTARAHGFPIDEDLLRSQAAFTHASFQGRLEPMRRGTGIGGRGMTVGYALWALDLAAWKPDEVTETMAAYLLKTQEDDGRFATNPSRPPLEDSPATSATLGAYALRRFSPAASKDKAEDAIERARAWLIQFEPERQEDRNSRLWGMTLLGATDSEREAARRAVLETQRDDGGWAQLPDLASDAYATGQSLWMLHESGFPTDAPGYRRGLRYLLSTQQSDGSWHVKTRSNPVQKPFETGFPHGEDQFISICGTSWAVAALAAARAPQPPPSR